MGIFEHQEWLIDAKSGDSVIEAPGTLVMD